MEMFSLAMWTDHKTKQLPLGSKDGHSSGNLVSLTARGLWVSPSLPSTQLAMNQKTEHWLISLNLGQEWKHPKLLVAGVSYDQFHHHCHETPSPHLIVSLSKGLTGVSRGAIKEETDSSYACVFPSSQPHRSLRLPCIQPDSHLQENL